VLAATWTTPRTALARAPAPAHDEGSREASDPAGVEHDAATPSPEDRAMAAYRRGTAHYNQARWADALADFEEAASLYASPDFQYDIGLCHEKLDEYAEAIRAFRTYLRAKPDAEDRANVEDRIARLQRQLDEKQAPRPAAAVRESTPPPPRSRGGAALVASGAALVATGGALALGGGVGFGVAALRRSRRVDDVASGNPESLTFDEAERIEASGQRFEIGQVATIAAGGAIAVLGAVLLGLGVRRRAGAGATALVPAGDGRTIGAAIVGRF
jgi:tetratricopeptide (TPR) repeat protein